MESNNECPTAIHLDGTAHTDPAGPLSGNQQQPQQQEAIPTNGRDSHASGSRGRGSRPSSRASRARSESASSSESQPVAPYRVVHVTGVKPLDQYEGRVNLGQDSWFVTKDSSSFHAGVAGDVVFTSMTLEVFEEAAASILLNLCEEAAVSDPLVLVGYDVGCLVVKLMAILACQDARFQRLFAYRPRALLLCGGPNRSNGKFDMERRLSSFLDTTVFQTPTYYSQKNGEMVKYLAEAALEINDLFWKLKAPFYWDLISVYASGLNDSSIHPSFDDFAGALGLSQEISLIEPQYGDMFTLSNRLSRCLDEQRQRPLYWNCCLQETLLRIAAPQMPHKFQMTDEPHPVVQQAAFKEFCQSTSGRDVVYIESCARDLLEEAVDRAAQTFISRRSVKICFRFRFNRNQHGHRTFYDMLSSLVATFYLHPAASSEDRQFLSNFTYYAPGAWTELDLLMLIRLNCSDLCDKSLYVLEGFEQCDEAERQRILAWLAEFGAQGVDRFKFIISGLRRTSQGFAPPHSGCVNVDTILGTAQPRFDDIIERGPCASSIPSQFRGTITAATERLKEMETSLARDILQIIHDFVGWPSQPDVQWMSYYIELMDLVSQSSSPSVILDHILRRYSRPPAFKRFICGLILLGRPITISEARMLTRGVTGTQRARQPFNRGDDKAFMSSWNPTLRVLANINYDTIEMKPHISDAMGEDNPPRKFVWNECRREQAAELAESILKMFARTKGTGPLRYAEACKRFPWAIAPPIRTSRLGRSSFLAELFPRCLREMDESSINAVFSKSGGDLGGSLRLWAEWYWAISNPLLGRPKIFPTSGYPLLVEFGLPTETLGSVSDRDKELAAISAARRGRKDFLETALRGDCSPSLLHETLLAAAYASHEDLSCWLVRKITAAPKNHREGGVGGGVVSGGPYRDNSDNDWVQTLIWRAAWAGMEKLATELFEYGASPNPQSEFLDFWSPLCLAAEMGHARTYNVILDNGAVESCFARNVDMMRVIAMSGWTDLIEIFAANDRRLVHQDFPIIFAAGLGNHHTVQALLKLGADPNVSSNFNGSRDYTPLGLASDCGDHRSVEILLSGHENKKADPNFYSKSYEITPIWFAVTRGHLKVCSILLDHGADPNLKAEDDPLLPALLSSTVISKEDKFAIAKALLEHQPPAHINASKPGLGMTALMIAVDAELPDVVNLLIHHGADATLIDAQGKGALNYCASRGNREIMLALKSCNPPPSFDTGHLPGAVPLWKSALEREPYEDTLRLLLENKMPVDLPAADGTTLLMAMAWRGNELMVGEILEHSPDLNALTNEDNPDYPGWSALIFAADVNSPSVVTLLAGAGANLYIREKRVGTRLGWGAVHYAFRQGTECLQALLAHRGDAAPGDEKLVDQVAREYEMRPLHVTEYCWAQASSVRCLVRAGADVNALDGQGRSALNIAVHWDDFEISKFLLTLPNIDVNVVDSCDYGPPLHAALSDALYATASRLIERGADVNLEGEGWRSTPLIVCCSAWATRLAEKEVHRKISRYRIVQQLIRQGAKPDVVARKKGVSFYTPLCAAASSGDRDIVELILGHAVNVGYRDPLGRQAVHFAAWDGTEVLEMLLQRTGPAALGEKDKSGRTPLHWAAQMGNHAAVRWIISRSGKGKRMVNERDIDGWTPLCWAARGAAFWPANRGPGGRSVRSARGRWEATIQALLKAGADPSVECWISTPEGKREAMSPLKIAVMNRCGGKSSENQKVLGLLGQPAQKTADGEHDRTDQAGPEKPGNMDRGDNVEVREDAGGQESSKQAEPMEQEKGPPRYYSRYDDNRSICEVCFWRILGLQYTCRTCPNYNVCKKCYAHIDIFHSHFLDGEGENGKHEFKLADRVEYEDMMKEVGLGSDAGSESDTSEESLAGEHAFDDGGSEGSRASDGGDNAGSDDGTEPSDNESSDNHGEGGDLGDAGDGGGRMSPVAGSVGSEAGEEVKVNGF